MICKFLLDRPNNTQAQLSKFRKNAKNVKVLWHWGFLNPLTKKITQRKQRVVKDTNKSNSIKISINIICWKCNNKDAKNNVCIDIQTPNLLIYSQICYPLCQTYYLGFWMLWEIPYLSFKIFWFVEKIVWTTQITLRILKVWTIYSPILQLV